jgi:hypothetical protein
VSIRSLAKMLLPFNFLIIHPFFLSNKQGKIIFPARSHPSLLSCQRSLICPFKAATWEEQSQRSWVT